MARIIIETDGGERFCPDEVERLQVYADGSALVVFKDPYGLACDISQTELTSTDCLTLAIAARELADFLQLYLSKNAEDEK